MTLANPRIGQLCGNEDSGTPDHDIEGIARERMERARVDLLLDHSYFAAALLSIPIRGTSEQVIPHAVATDGLRIVYRYDLVASLDRPRVRILMMHALVHVLLQHPERGQHREWRLWTRACDIAVDLLFMQIGIEQRQGQEHLWRFQGLSAEGIYAVLQERSEPSLPSDPPPDDGMLRPPPSESVDSCESNEERDLRQSFERAVEGSERPTPVQLEALKRGFREATVEIGTRCAGTGAGTGNAEIDAAANEQVCWRTVLARFMREPIGRDWSFARPNRKHLWRGLYLPGPVEVEGGRFVLAIDTSGSMSDRDLGLVLGEVDAIRRTCACELTVLQFDAAIHATAEFSHWSEENNAIGSTKVMRVYGRGGTNLRLPFDWVEKEQSMGRRVSALIVCTDGFGLIPAEPPQGLPVLFMLTPVHQAPKFGEQLVLGPGNQSMGVRRDHGTTASSGGTTSITTGVTTGGTTNSQASGEIAKPPERRVDLSIPSWARGRMI